MQWPMGVMEKHICKVKSTKVGWETNQLERESRSPKHEFTVKFKWQCKSNSSFYCLYIYIYWFCCFGGQSNKLLWQTYLQLYFIHMSIYYLIRCTGSICGACQWGVPSNLTLATSSIMPYLITSLALLRDASSPCWLIRFPCSLLLRFARWSSFDGRLN